jgi:hypothetical protein
VPTLMVTEPFFSVPATVTPIVQGNVAIEPVIDSHVPMVVTPIVGSPMTEINKEEEHIQMEGDPTSFEEAMRSAHSSKWLEAMEDEMRSMSTNKVWDFEEIP